MTQARYAPLFAILLVTSVVFADETAKPTVADRITAAAMDNRLRLDFDGETFSGPAWD